MSSLKVESMAMVGTYNSRDIQMLQIGPFELDPATRRSLDNALGLGGSRPGGGEFR